MHHPLRGKVRGCSIAVDPRLQHLSSNTMEDRIWERLLPHHDELSDAGRRQSLQTIKPNPSAIPTRRVELTYLRVHRTPPVIPSKPTRPIKYTYARHRTIAKTPPASPCSTPRASSLPMELHPRPENPEPPTTLDKPDAPEKIDDHPRAVDQHAAPITIDSDDLVDDALMGLFEDARHNCQSCSGRGVVCT